MFHYITVIIQLFIMMNDNNSYVHSTIKLYAIDGSRHIFVFKSQLH